MPQTEDNPTPPFPAYRVTVDGVGLYITGHEGGYNVVYPDGRYETITAEYPDRAHAAADLTGKVHAIPVPQSVKPWQMRRAINAAGLRASVDAALAQADRDTQDGWEVASEIRRDNPLIAGMASALGLTNQQVDALFIAADAYE